MGDYADVVDDGVAYREAEDGAGDAGRRVAFARDECVVAPETFVV